MAITVKYFIIYMAMGSIFLFAPFQFANAANFSKSSVKKCVIDQYEQYRSNTLKLMLFGAKKTKSSFAYKKEVLNIYKKIYKNTTLSNVRAIELVIKRDYKAFAPSPYPSFWESTFYKFGQKFLLGDRIYKKIFDENIQLYGDFMNKKYMDRKIEGYNNANHYIREISANTANFKLSMSGIELGKCYPLNMIEERYHSLITGTVIRSKAPRITTNRKTPKRNTNKSIYENYNKNKAATKKEVKSAEINKDDNKNKKEVEKKDRKKYLYIYRSKDKKDKEKDDDTDNKKSRLYIAR